MEILYKFYFEEEQNIKQKPYYIMKDEHHEKLTIKDIKKTKHNKFRYIRKGRRSYIKRFKRIKRR